MAKVILYDDTKRIQNNFSGYILNGIEDYVDCYKKIQEAIYKGDNLQVLIRDRFCLESLRKMQEIYGNTYIELKIYSLKEIIAEALKVEIPDYITEYDLKEAEVLTELDSFYYTKGMSFEDIILQNYIDQYWVLNKFSTSKLFDLLVEMDFQEYSKLMKRPLVNKAVKNKVNKWKSNVQEQYLIDIIDHLIKEPASLYEQLNKYLFISKYPHKLAVDAMGDIANSYKKLGLNRGPNISKPVDLLDIKNHIKIFWQGTKKDGLTNKEIVKMIDMVSGYFNDEFNHIVTAVKANPEVATTEVVELIRKKFNRPASEVMDVDEVLDNIVSPQKPSLISDMGDLNAEELIKWGTDEYLPFRFWLEENEANDDEVNKCSASFGERIFSMYLDLIAKGDYMIYKAIINISEELKANELSLLVVIDNFNYKYVPVLRDKLELEGFKNTRETPLLAMLPTETSISKRSLLSGQAYGLDNKSYDKLCQQWAELLGKKVKYLPGIGSLKGEVCKDADIYILNYNEIDSILHKSQKGAALSTRARVRSEVEALAKVISNFAYRIGYETKIKVYITSDHGSTKIPSEQTNIIDKQFYKGKCEDPRHRYISLNDSSYNSLNENVNFFCFPINRNIYGTKDNYLIAKKYYRFVETDDSYYVHGGITPEEMIIPFLKFEKIEIQVVPPYVNLQSKEFRYSVLSQIAFEIGNGNDYPLTDLEVSILNKNIKGDKYQRLATVNGLSKIVVSFDNLRILKESDFDYEIKLRLQYTCLSKHYETEYGFPIEIKSMQDNVLDLDDLF